MGLKNSIQRVELQRSALCFSLSAFKPLTLKLSVS